MNQDTLWQAIRYALLIGGGIFVGRKSITDEQLQLIIGLAALLFPALWGFYVKWNTTPVLDKEIVKADLPTISSATGAKVPPPSEEPKP